MVSNTCLPITSCLSILEHFHAWHLLSKQLHSDGHEQPTSVSVAAAGVNHQEDHQEDHQDNANHAALGHAARFRGRDESVSMAELKSLVSY